MGLTGVTSSDRQDDLADVDTGNSSVGLSPRTTHSSLQSIGTGARQHLVDTDDVVGVSANTHVETFLSGGLDEVLVGADTGGFESLGAQLLVLVGDEVDAEREVIDTSTLSAKIEDSDLRVGDTTVEPGLGIRLEELNISIHHLHHLVCEYEVQVFIMIGEVDAISIRVVRKRSQINFARQ